MSNEITGAAAPTQPLYKRSGDYIPRVAAVHDLCGYGKCSLGVAIPVLSAAGCDVCPVPTGLFSSHTAFPGWYMHDTTEILPDYLAAWQNIGVEIDAIYSGDQSQINEAFCGDLAYYNPSDGQLYSIYWLSDHTAADYQAAGVPVSEVERILDDASAMGGSYASLAEAAAPAADAYALG